MVEVTWSPGSVADINAIANYIAKDSPQAAAAQVEAILNKGELLRKHPAVGKPVPELKDTSYRELPVNRYRIIYRIVSDKTIHILTIHHQSRLLKNNVVAKKILRRRKKR